MYKSNEKTPHPLDQCSDEMLCTLAGGSYGCMEKSHYQSKARE